MTTEDYGSLVVLRKTGELGPAFTITSNIAIGREKNCDIRIKLDCVSRLHSTITIDQNGHCIVNHHSKTNPTYVNGESIEDSTELKDGDKINIGEREFVYKSVVKTATSKTPLKSKDSAMPISARKPLQQNNSSEKKQIRLKTPLRNDIHTHLNVERKTEDIGQSKSCDEKIVNRYAKVATPLRKAINDRRMSFTASPKDDGLPKSVNTAGAKDVSMKPTFNDELSKALHARRSKISTPSKPSLGAQSIVLDAQAPIMMKSEESSDHPSSSNILPTVNVDKVSQYKMVNTPMRRAIEARRVSFSKMSNEPSHIRRIATSPRRNPASIKTPLRRAIEKRREIIDAYETVAPKLEVAPVDKPQSFSSPIRQTVVSSRNTPKSNRSARMTGMEKDITQPESFVAASIQAVCAELAVAAFSNESIAQENVEPQIALDVATTLFQESPAKFRSSLAGTEQVTSSEMDCDVEKDSEEIVDNMATESVEEVSYETKVELINTLSEAEMQVIEDFADKISQIDSNIPAEESYLLATDAYFCGVEAYHRYSIEKQAPVAEQQEIEVKSNEPIDFSYGASLRDLFKLPKEYISIYDDDYDMEMVENYAKDIVNCSGVSEDIAYGIALDTFLADPVYFRKNFGGTAVKDQSIDVAEDAVFNELDEDISINTSSMRLSVSEPVTFVNDAMNIEPTSEQPETNALKTPIKSSSIQYPHSSVRRSTRLASRIDTETVSVAPTPAKTPRKSAVKVMTSKKNKVETIDAQEPLSMIASDDLPANDSDSADKSEDKAVCNIDSLMGEAASADSISATPSKVEPIAEVSTDKSKGSRRRIATPVPTEVNMSEKKQSAGRGNQKRKFIDVQPIEEEEDAEEIVLLCDGCDGEFHLEDLGLSAIPEGDWFCENCTSSKTSRKTTRSTAKSSKSTSKESNPPSKRARVSKSDTVATETEPDQRRSSRRTKA